MKARLRFLIFLGFEALFCGIVYLMIRTNIIAYSQWRETWPIFAAFSGIALLVSGLVSTKKISLSFLVPSIALIVLGLLFMLFSTDVFTISIGELFRRWWWVLLIAALLVLAVIYAYKKLGKNKD